MVPRYDWLQQETTRTDSHVPSSSSSVQLLARKITKAEIQKIQEGAAPDQIYENVDHFHVPYSPPSPISRRVS